MLSGLTYQDRSRILNYVFLLVILLFLIGGYVLFCFTAEQKKPLLFLPHPSVAKPLALQNAPMTGQNLSLESPLIEVSLIDLKNEIEIQAPDYRPDQRPVSPVITCILKKTGQRKECFSKEKVFLSKSKQLSFSSEPTPFWFIPSFLPSKKVMVTVGVDLPKGAVLATEEKLAFSLVPKDVLIQEKDPLAFPQFMKVLTKGKWWGKDLLVPPEKGRELLEIDEEAPYVCHVQEGSWLLWKEGKWQVGSLMEGKGFPIAHVKSVIDKKQMEIEGWNEEGTEKYLFVISEQPPLPVSSRFEELFSSFHLRTKKQISCLCGKQRLLLRQGDWMRVKEGKWRKHILGGSDNLHEGDLLHFEKISEEGGKKLVVFSLYNSTHTVKKTFSKPLIRQQQQQTPSSNSSLPKNENRVKGKERSRP